MDYRYRSPRQLRGRKSSHEEVMVRRPNTARYVYGWLIFASIVGLLALIAIFYFDSKPDKFALWFLVPFVVGGLSVWGFFYTWNNEVLSSDEELRRVQSKYSPNMNRYAAGKETKASVARTALVQQQGLESRAVADKITQRTELKQKQIEHAHISPRMEEQRAVESALNKATQTKNEVDEHLTRDAGKKGFTLDTHQKIKEEEARAQIEIIKTQALKDLETKTRWTEIEQDLDAADRYELTPHALVSNLTQYLFKMHEQYRQAEKEESDEWLKEKKLKRLQKNMDTLEMIIDERQTRLLSVEDRSQEVRGIAAPDSRTNSGEETEGNQEQVPAEDSGDRPRWGNNY